MDIDEDRGVVEAVAVIDRNDVEELVECVGIKVLPPENSF